VCFCAFAVRAGLRQAGLAVGLPRDLAPGPQPEIARGGNFAKQKRLALPTHPRQPLGPAWGAARCVCVSLLQATCCAHGGVRDRRTWRLAFLEIWLQDPSGLIWSLPLWSPGKTKGVRVGGLAHMKQLSRIASERQLQQDSRRKTQDGKSRQQRTGASHLLTALREKACVALVSSRSVVELSMRLFA
jgi:hypothetical protein